MENFLGYLFFMKKCINATHLDTFHSNSHSDDAKDEKS